MTTGAYEVGDYLGKPNPSMDEVLAECVNYAFPNGGISWAVEPNSFADADLMIWFEDNPRYDRPMSSSEEKAELRNVATDRWLIEQMRWIAEELGLDIEPWLEVTAARMWAGSSPGDVAVLHHFELLLVLAGHQVYNSDTRFLALSASGSVAGDFREYLRSTSRAWGCWRPAIDTLAGQRPAQR